MSKQKKYPVGISDYKKIVEGGYFFWDKSDFVENFFEQGGEVTLILRPRRWSKTTMLSMVKYFFDSNECETANKLFKNGNVKVNQAFVDRHAGKYPVIFFSFNDCVGKDWEMMYGTIVRVVASIFNLHKRYIFDKLEKVNQVQYEKIWMGEASEAEVMRSLKWLSEMYYLELGKRVIILIDEYDRLLVESFNMGYYDEANSFISGMMTSALKDNSCLEKALLTGVTRVAKSGYLSKLNNLKVYSMNDRKFCDDFGILPDEIEKLLIEENISDKGSEIEEYYDGYSTGSGKRLYNPWSIINYMEDRELKPYWVLTGSLETLHKSMLECSKSTKKDMHALLKKQEVTKNVENEVSLKRLPSDDAFFSLLYCSGYVTSYDGKIRVPNKEVLIELSEVYQILAASTTEKFTVLMNAIVNGEAETVQEMLQEYFSTHSNRSLRHEYWSQAITLALTYPLDGKYDVSDEAFQGEGYSDLTLLPKDYRKAGVIFEMKVPTKARAERIRKGPNYETDMEDELKSLAKVGLQQIHDRNYMNGENTRDYNRFFLYGLAVHREKVQLVFEDYQRPNVLN